MIVNRRALLGLGAAVGASLAGCSRAVRSVPTAGRTGPIRSTVTSGAPATSATAPAATRSAAATAAASSTPVISTGPAREISAGTGSRPEVALTFHGAGDPAIARRLLAIFRRSGAKVTVLAVGSWLADNPGIAREIVAGGHLVGNHTYNHLDIDSLEPNAARAEIVRCRDLLRAQIDTGGPFFRPSQTQHASPQVLALAGAAGYPVCLSYNLDSLDYTDPGPDAVRATMAAAVAGSIVSLHFGHPGTVTAMPGILADLASRGLRPVTAARLLR